MLNTLFKWFTDNHLKTKPKKSHLLTNPPEEIQINIRWNGYINNIDNKLTYERKRNKKCIIQSLMNFLQKTVPSKFITIICRNYLLKHSKLKYSLLPKS